MSELALDQIADGFLRRYASTTPSNWQDMGNAIEVVARELLLLGGHHDELQRLVDRDRSAADTRFAEIEGAGNRPRPWVTMGDKITVDLSYWNQIVAKAGVGEATEIERAQSVATIASLREQLKRAKRSTAADEPNVNITITASDYFGSVTAQGTISATAPADALRGKVAEAAASTASRVSDLMDAHIKSVKDLL